MTQILHNPKGCFILPLMLKQKQVGLTAQYKRRIDAALVVVRGIFSLRNIAPLWAGYVGGRKPCQLLLSGLSTRIVSPTTIDSVVMRLITQKDIAMFNKQIAPTSVQFHGHPLTIITTEDGTRMVAMRSICEAIGLDWKSQYNRISRHPVLSSCVVVMTTQVPGDSQSREMVFLPIEYLNGWLFGIDSKRVKPELKEKLEIYQRECYAALASYWLDGGAKSPQYQIMAPDQRPLTEDEQSTLAALIGDAAHDLPYEQQSDFIVKCWAKLTDHYQCGTSEIPRSQYSNALAIVARFIASWEQGLGEKTNVEKAYALAAAAANGISKAVFETVLKGGKVEDGQWLVKLKVERDRIVPMVSRTTIERW